MRLFGRDKAVDKKKDIPGKNVLDRWRNKREETEKKETERSSNLKPTTEQDIPDETAVTENLYIKEAAEKPDWLQVSAASLIGSRKNQQDSLGYTFAKDKGFLAVVCDGMGGLGGGELASFTACSSLLAQFKKSKEESPPEFFMHTACVLDEEVAGITGKAGEPLGAGTTLVSVWLKQDRLFWLSVGDSKIYLVRNHNTTCLTTAHNYRMLLEKRLQDKTITQEQYDAGLAQGEALVSYIGMCGLKYMDISMEGLALEAGDQIVLCSDGFYRQCSEEQLAQCLDELSGEYETYAGKMAEAVIRNQPRRMDNTTLILIRYTPVENKQEKGENEK